MKKVCLIIFTIFLLGFISCENPSASLYDYMTGDTEKPTEKPTTEMPSYDPTTENTLPTETIETEPKVTEVWKYTKRFQNVGGDITETFIVEKENGKVIYKSHHSYFIQEVTRCNRTTSRYIVTLHANEEIPYISYTISTTNLSGDIIVDPNTYIEYLTK